MRINFNTLNGFSPRELEKLQRAKDLLEKVLSSGDYRQAVLSSDFSGETSSWALKSNEEILEHILSGSEILIPMADNEADMSITIFSPNWFQRGLVGYTYPNVVMQWVSRKFFMAMSVPALAGHLFHEWLHKMGFDHDFLPTPRRKNSVCYIHNEIIECLGRKIHDLHPTHAKQPKKKYSRSNIFVRAWRWFTGLL